MLYPPFAHGTQIFLCKSFINPPPLFKHFIWYVLLFSQFFRQICYPFPLKFFPGAARPSNWVHLRALPPPPGYSPLDFIPHNAEPPFSKPFSHSIDVIFFFPSLPPSGKSHPLKKRISLTAFGQNRSYWTTQLATPSFSLIMQTGFFGQAPILIENLCQWTPPPHGFGDSPEKQPTVWFFPSLFQLYSLTWFTGSPLELLFDVCVVFMSPSFFPPDHTLGLFNLSMNFFPGLTTLTYPTPKFFPP